jgi:TRAP-type mannitol/chloroaromatic compound transport system substrate-binding protein
MERRSFIKGGALGAAGALAAPSIARAQETFSWRMTTTWPPQQPFYQVGPGSAEDIAQKIEEMSGGRITIQVFAAGEMIPAFEGFDAASQGIIEMNHGVAYYWAGKHPATQYFGTVPFGMSFQGQNAWYYHGGGLELWNELYDQFNLVAMPCGNTGVQMTGWFREPIETLDDFNGLKMRIPGLAGKVYASLGVSVVLLPGGEIFPALERGVVDAAEWVGPYQDRRLGLHNAAKNYYTTGWHEPSTTSELVINKEAYNQLPDDLKAIVLAAARSANVTSHTWSEANNSEALTDLVQNEGVNAQPLPDDVVRGLRTATDEVLADLAEQDPFTKKVHESYMAFKKRHDAWAELSEAVFLSIN